MNRGVEKYHSDNKSSGYEKKDINVIRVIGIGITVIVLIVLAIVLLDEYFISAREKLMYEVVLRPESTKLRELRAREIEELNSYKLLDAGKDIYRIPIERAMKILAEKEYQSKAGMN